MKNNRLSFTLLPLNYYRIFTNIRAKFSFKSPFENFWLPISCSNIFNHHKMPKIIFQILISSFWKPQNFNCTRVPISATTFSFKISAGPINEPKIKTHFQNFDHHFHGTLLEILVQNYSQWSKLPLDKLGFTSTSHMKNVQTFQSLGQFSI